MQRSILLFIVLSLISITVHAIELPEKAIGKPTIFKSAKQGYRWEEMAKDRNFGEYTNDPWTVYVSCNDAVAYSEASSGSDIVQSLKFMEDFNVAAIKGDYMLLYYTSTSGDKSLDIPRKVKKTKSTINRNGIREDGYVGWVKIDDLLLWNECPMTKDGIYEKVCVVKDVEHLNPGNVNKSPRLYGDQNCNGSYIYSVNANDFYFCYKKGRGNNALICVDNKMRGNMTSTKAGWIERDEYIPWNTRICWEPAFDRRDNGINNMAYSYQNEFSAQNFNNSDIIAKVQLTSRRQDPSMARSAILGYSSFTAQMAVIGTPGKSTPYDPAKTAEILNKIEALKNSMSRINVVFVMDGSNSMKECFSSMSNAVKEISKYRYFDDDRMHFGAVVFRNYKDEASGDLVEMMQLTNNTEKLSQFLDNVRCFSAEHNDPQEALFYGLNYAADKIVWENNANNFIILVGDVSSKEPDVKGLNAKKIIDKLASKNINLMAFQARSYPETAYRNFALQIQPIIKGLLNRYGYGDSKPTAEGRIMMYQPPTRDVFPFRPMGFKWKTSNDQNINATELKNMVVETFKIMIEKTKDALAKLNGQNSENGGGDSGVEFEQSVCDYLISQRIIHSCDDLKNLIKVTGYSRMCYNDDSDKQMFAPCVFLAEVELTNLIQDMQDAVRANSQNRRVEIQRVCQKLMLSYTGQKLESSGINKEAIQQIEKECGYKLDQLASTHIQNPNYLNESDFNVLLNSFKTSISNLEKVQKDKGSYKYQNGSKYYYILLDDMPLMKKNL